MNKEDNFSKIFFSTRQSEKEWKEMDVQVKRSVVSNLVATSKQMKNEMAIEMLCHVINDLIKRIEVLEKEG